MSGRDGHGDFRRTVEVGPAAVHPEARPLRWLWARKQVEWLEDDLHLGNEEVGEPLVGLGLQYAIVTSRTSFVAVDHVVANPGGAQASAVQPLPLPKGVSTAALSRSVMPPGDPVLTVAAPADARLVTAYFPFGLVKDLQFDPVIDRWQTRFLVPAGVADGEYRIPVTVLHADGRLETVTASYRIDSHAPDFDLAVVPGKGGVSLRVEGNEPFRRVTVALVDDPRVRVELTARAGERSFVGWLPLPAGSHRLRVVVADQARNEAEHVAFCQVSR